MAVMGNGNTEIDLHALAVFLKICSPYSTNLKNSSVLDLSDFSTDRVRSGGTLPGNIF